MSRLSRILACVLLAATACSGSSMHTAPARAPRSTASATADADSNLKPAHDFTLATFEGDTFTLSDHFGELPVVLNFWAPW